MAALRAAEARKLPFNTRNLLLTSINLRTAGKASNASEANVFVNQCLNALRGADGVTAVGGFSAAPLMKTGTTNLVVDEIDPSLAVDP